MAAPVTHFEISVRDTKRAHEFYGNLFGWSIKVMEMNYGMVDTGVKMGINGGVGEVQNQGRPNVTFYVQVEDVQAHLDKASALGGRVIIPVTEVPGSVTFAQFADLEGNIVGLIKGPQSPPKPASPKRKPAARAKKAAKPKKKARKGGKRR